MIKNHDIELHDKQRVNQSAVQALALFCDLLTVPYTLTHVRLPSCSGCLVAKTYGERSISDLSLIRRDVGKSRIAVEGREWKKIDLVKE